MAQGLLLVSAMIHVPMTQPARKATADDLRAAHGEDGRAEVIHGVIVEKAMPRAEHCATAGYSLLAIARRFDRRPGGKWPGGWWLRPELHVQYETNEVFCHDNCGFRRDRMPESPTGWPVKTRPDWVCELLSPNHHKRDRIDKWRVLHTSGVPHYWIVDPEEKILEVLRWERADYTRVLIATSGDIIRAEPFDAVELRTAVLFGDEDDEE